MTSDTSVPIPIRTHLAHATLQGIAYEAGCDVLHIKGPSTDPSLRPPEKRGSVDADVLVRPSHVSKFLKALGRRGWARVTRLLGATHHSTNWFHPQLGQVDVHVRFPGIQIAPEDAFDMMWSSRGATRIANCACTVPGLAHQRLIQLLHAARSGPERAREVDLAWTEAPPSIRDDVTELAIQLDAEVALAAATGRLSQFSDRPEYELWRLYGTSGESNALRFIAAAAKAAPDGQPPALWSAWERLRYLLLHKRERLRSQLGRNPTLAEMAHGYALATRRLWHDIKDLIRSSNPRDRRKTHNPPPQHPPVL